jgi:hypothetical protein
MNPFQQARSSLRVSTPFIEPSGCLSTRDPRYCRCRSSSSSNPAATSRHRTRKHRYTVTEQSAQHPNTAAVSFFGVDQVRGTDPHAGRSIGLARGGACARASTPPADRRRPRAQIRKGPPRGGPLAFLGILFHRLTLPTPAVLAVGLPCLSICPAANARALAPRKFRSGDLSGAVQ